VSAGVWPPAELVAEIQGELGGRSSDLALVLGSGLGGITERMRSDWSREAADIPGYPRSTVVGHKGRLRFGTIGGCTLWVVEGRVHLYEGYGVEEVTRYVRLLRALGVGRLLLTNAAGSVDAGAAGPGDIVLCRDAVSFFFRALAEPEWRGAWRSRGALSDPELCRIATEVARREGIALRPGVLVGSLGPSYETAAEVRAWRRIGGTVASMSTVPEAIAARELGMRCLLFSLVTNYGTGLSLSPLDHSEVVEVADRAGAALERFVTCLLRRLAS
jgi:purine-nucleoside phosphorylase